MNLDTHRVLALSRSRPDLHRPARLLVDADPVGALDAIGDGVDADDIDLGELEILALYAAGRLVAARRRAELVLQHADRAGSGARRATLARTLAERIWNVDLRAGFDRAHELLDPRAEAPDLDEVEVFRRRVDLADFAQCRGHHALAGGVLVEAERALDRVETSAQAGLHAACTVVLEQARSRSLQGRHRVGEALASIERGLAAARECQDAVGEIRLLIRRARTQYAMDDRDAGRRTRALLIERYRAFTARPAGVVCLPELATELLFTRGELAVYDLRPAAAERHLRAGGEIAVRIGSHEGYVESTVVLTAALLMQERADEARRQFEASRDLCRGAGYDDLAADLEKLRGSHRFRRLIGSAERDLGRSAR